MGGIEPPPDLICLLVRSATELHRSLFIIVGREALVVLLIPVHLPRVDTTHPAVSSLGVSLTVILTRSYRTISKNFRLSAYSLLLTSAAAHRWVVRQFRIVPTESSSCQGTLLWWRKMWESNPQADFSTYALAGRCIAILPIFLLKPLSGPGLSCPWTICSLLSVVRVGLTFCGVQSLGKIDSIS